MRRGMTTVGVHRDDLLVEVGDKPAGAFASQGQSRALVLAFKLAELRLAKEREGVPPVLLLDDVSSELDPRRSAALFEVLSEDAGQCVITTTAPGYVTLASGVPRVDIKVERGVIEQGS